jgi:hypothetical protein
MKRVMIIVAVFAISVPVWSAPGQDIALVLKVQGMAEVQKTSSWDELNRGHRINSGDKIRTGHDAMVALVFTDDKSMMKIRSESELTIRGEREEEGIKKRLMLALGSLWSKIKPGGAEFKVETPSGVAAVKGTEFYTIVDDEGTTRIIGITGIVELLNDLGSVMVKAGQTGILHPDASPDVTETDSFEDWANTGQDETRQLEIEFEDESSDKKTLKIKYRNP